MNISLILVGLASCTVYPTLYFLKALRVIQLAVISCNTFTVERLKLDLYSRLKGFFGKLYFAIAPFLINFN